jgi:hypothetical protein
MNIHGQQKVKLDPNEAGCKDGDLMGLAQYQV